MRKVYCASQFFCELDLLEIKLHTLAPYVDYFVISESLKTHSGKDKIPYYELNKNRYLKFHDKIIHNIITYTPSTVAELKWWYNKNNFPPNITSLICQKVLNADWFDKKIESYMRDTYEKEALLLPIYKTEPNENDIILLGDLDEIPSPQAMEVLLENFNPECIYHFKQGMFYYYLNLEKTNEPWRGTLAVSYKRFLENSFCKMRTYKEGSLISNGGWHFTYMGGPQKILQKVQSWGEQSLNVPKITNNIAENVMNFDKKNHDLFYRKANFVIRDIEDGTFPDYIVKNKEKFSNMILPFRKA